jgi:transcriptional antiterminator RfaH
MGYGRLDETLRWYAIHTHHRQEDRAETNLMAWKIETFHPKLRLQRHHRYTGNQMRLTKSLFPQYIFARFHADRLFTKIRLTRGVHSVVNFGGDPVPIDDQIIALLQTQVREDGFVRIGEKLKSGDKVIIEDGPLKNFVAIFEREIEGTDRVMVLLSAISYQGRANVGRDTVKKATSIVRS